MRKSPAGKKDTSDKDYIKMREALIPEAEMKANERCGETRGRKSSEVWAAEWNYEFHGQMEKLVKDFLADCTMGWIVGADACRKYINAGSWKSAKRWIKRYNAPLRYWVDGRPVFYKSEIDEWLKKTKIEEVPNEQP
jgi:hypothetical protein